MAVYQIARIQVRRGLANSGTGLPQLASGEMAWCVDTQQLYIGNGSVAEGAPAVGNTRLLSLNDLSASGNVLQLIQYAYRANDPSIITAPTGITYRTMQAHMDELVTAASFGAVGDGVTDDTAALQLAIDQLFLNANTYAYNNTAAGAGARVALHITQGIYKITSTLYVPSYATIIGIGSDKTIINFVPTAGDTSPAFRFVNDTSTSGNPNPPIAVGNSSSFQYSNQPRHISLKGVTIQTLNGTNIALQLDAVRDSNFEDIKIVGDTASYTTYNSTNIGILMQAHSSVVTCRRNVFNNIKFFSVGTAVYAQQDIINNDFNDCFIEDALRGFVLGEGSLGGSVVGQQYGPAQTAIRNSKFKDVREHAIYLERGKFNTVTNVKLFNVGNNNAGNLLPSFPQIYIKTLGNGLDNIQSDRTDDLSIIDNVPYLPEIAGNVTYTSYGTRQITTGQINTPIQLFRLPVQTDKDGAPGGSVRFAINYLFKSTVNSFSRQGTISVAADVTAGKLQLSDDFEFAGNDAENTIAQLLEFFVRFLDADGNLYTGALGQTPSSIAIYYMDKLTGNAGEFNYSFTSTAYHS